MADDISEELLESIYHQPITQLFSEVFKAEFVAIFKPTRQKEVWVGFDRAWVKTSLTIDELYKQLRDNIHSGEHTISDFYFGLFLQFKIVSPVKRSSRYLPSGYYVPYYRSELSLNPNRLTGLSQHETLIRLNNIENANVAYACPMIFGQKDLHNPDLDKLKIVDISTSPSGWLTNESHFITFQNENGNDTRWCSEATPGRNYKFREWIERIIPNRLTGEKIIELIEESKMMLEPKKEEPLSKENIYEFLEKRHSDRPIQNIIPQCFTIFKFKKDNNIKNNSE
jgi:hypothetical protein